MSTMENEYILILDFGSQYTQLIARRVREQKVYCEILPFNQGLKKAQAQRPAGIILSGGPASVFGKDAPVVDKALFELGVPVLAICYGLQLLSHLLGGEVSKSSKQEYGRCELCKKENDPLLAGIDDKSIVWMSHGDHVTRLPTGYKTLAYSENTEWRRYP